MQIRDVMTGNPVCCTPETSIEDVARVMVECDCGAVPVVGDRFSRLPLGIITDRDIVTRAIAAGHDPMDLTARDCMTTPAVTIVEDANLRDCVQLLELSQIRRVIVVDASGGCCGIVAQADIASHASKRETGDLVQKVSQPSAPALA
jgi:CBS domain-containing protein